QAGMGVHGGDYDNDGDLDLFVTNFSEDVNTLYRNDGDWLFADATSRAGLDGVVRPFLGFGTGFFDWDNDGWLDIFVANGHLYPQLEQLSSGLRYRQRNLLYRNAGGRFLEAGAAAGPGLSAAAVSRAVAFGDYDNDGDADLYVANLNDEPALLRNDGGNRNSWIGLELEGGESNRDAIGASVRVSAGSLVQMREVHRGYGFQAQHDPRLLFGLGDSPEPPRVEILWPSGKRQVLEKLPLRRYVAIREGVDGFVAGPVREPIAAAGSPGPAPADPVAPEKEPFPSLPAASAPAAASPDSPAAAPGLDPAAQQFYREARAHYSEGRLPEAAEALEQAVRADPEGDRAFLLLGKTFLNLNRDREAVAALEKAHALDPGNWEYSNLLGVAYRRAGRMEEAFGAFATAAGNAPWAPRPHLNLARLYDEIGQPGSAEVERRLFEQWRPLQRESEVALDMVKSNPDDPLGRRNLGLAYTRQGRHAEALAEFRRACDLDPDDGMARYGLGEALHREKRYAEAVESYEQALELVPGDAGVHTGLGRSLAALGRVEAAAEQFRTALASDRGHAAAHLGLGELALKQRDEAAAVRACGRAVQHQPALALAHSCVGSAHAAAGRYDAAASALGRALELDARLVQTRYALGLVHHLEGRYPEAVGEWKRVLLLAPGHVRARQGIAQAKRESEARR
ncbi:MAG: tetratricopeptide repeat protein, partial [Gemmatimonadetes bacterium]|nr:tetratricopeptide repeat protein [Gemmatimonadota bacterium]